MTNTKFVKIVIKISILELGPIVSPNVLDLHIEFVEALEENRLKTSCTS